ncbi:MAG: hypothetical protein HWD59_06540 [Coxiellaceae bacterium]|nr:MAG: hypothetical protein HWD59_06540 [Coxiellaceae bacterium]
MFTWINKQGVKSDKGFVVQSVGRFTIQYIDKLKVISIEVERGFLPNRRLCVNITKNAFEKWDDGTPILKEKQAEILQNFKEALKFQDIEVLVD